MNVDELRIALREQAETIADHDPVRHVAGVRERVRGIRRRRVVGAAALTVTALAVVSAVMTLPGREAAPADKTPAPTTQVPAPLPTVQHEDFVSHSGEYDLVAAMTGEAGESKLALTVPPHAEELHVTMTCYGMSGPVGLFWVSGYGGDSRPARPSSNWCGGDPDEPVVPGVSGPEPWSYDVGFRLKPSTDPQTVHVELTQELDDNGKPLDNPSAMGTYTPVTNPDVVLGMGVYKVAAPVVTVLGTEIPPRVGLDGVDYAYADHRASKPGDRKLTWTLPPSAKVRYYDTISDNAEATDDPSASISASYDGGSCMNVWMMSLRYRAGGCLLSAGVPHTITVTIDPGMPEDAVAGIVLYERGQ